MFCGGIFNIIAEKKDVYIWQLCPLPCSWDFATAFPHVIARRALPDVAIRIFCDAVHRAAHKSRRRADSHTSVRTGSE